MGCQFGALLLLLLLLLLLQRLGGARGYFFDFVLVPFIGTRAVVGEGFRACEFVVGGGGGDYVAVAGYLAGEAGDGAGDWGDGSIEGLGADTRGSERTLVDLAEDDDAGEFGLRIARDDGVVEVYTWICLMDV